MHNNSKKSLSFWDGQLLNDDADLVFWDFLGGCPVFLTDRHANDTQTHTSHNTKLSPLDFWTAQNGWLNHKCNPERDKLRDFRTCHKIGAVQRRENYHPIPKHPCKLFFVDGNLEGMFEHAERTIANTQH